MSGCEGGKGMKIRVDLHNPLRGMCTCEHCHVPIIHGDDDWHAFLAKDVSKAFGEHYDGVHTDAKWYPAMMDRFANMLASKADSYLFCPYCGKAITQPRTSNITNKPILPNVYANNSDAVKRWAKEIGIEVPLDYHKYQDMHYELKKDAKVMWN
jgi:hypothetical protein